MKRFLLIIFLGLALIPLISAHAEEGIEPPKIISLIWAFHSWTHWLVWIFFIYTCYYFRYLFGHVSNHPKYCMAEEKKKEYSKEDRIKQMHGVFVWIMLVWAIIHLSELVGAQLGYSELPVYSIGEFIHGDELWEWVYIVSTMLFLFSCHYIRYIIGGSAKCFSCLKFGEQRQNVFRFQTFINNYHGYFFWLAIISSFLVLLSGGHL